MSQYQKKIHKIAFMTANKTDETRKICRTG